jgi:hypothetical protein
MKNLAIAALGLSALFMLSACGDPNAPAAPSPYVDVPAPAWAQTVQVERVSKHSAVVKNSAGQSVRVARSGTDIGNGLTATRDMWDLYVQDGQGVKCNWNSGERLEWCRMPNPAYTAGPK